MCVSFVCVLIVASMSHSKYQLGQEAVLLEFILVERQNKLAVMIFKNGAAGSLSFVGLFAEKKKLTSVMT